MNPVVYQRVMRFGINPLKNLQIVFRKSSYRRRDFSTFVLGKKGRTYAHTIAEHNCQVLTLSSYRLFSTAPSAAESNTGVYWFGLLSTIGMMGGIYYYSNSLKKTDVFNKAIDIMNECPELIDFIGSKVKSHSLARGRVNNEKTRIVFVIKGENGEYLVTLEAHVVNDETTIHQLSLHKRGSIPAYEFYVYKDGVYVAKVLDDDVVEDNPVEQFAEEEKN